MRTKHIQNHIKHFKHAMLQHHASAADVLASADENPDVPLLQCYAASLCLYEQTQIGTNTAKHYLEHAATHQATLTSSEQPIFQALMAWSLLRHRDALTLFHQALQINPHDLLLLKYIEWIFHILGQTDHAHMFQTICEEIASYHQESPYFLSMYAFALTLAGKRTAALHQTAQALALKPNLAWAQHAAIHAYTMQGNTQTGIQSLCSNQEDWDKLTPKLRSHLYWHLALFHIAEHNMSEAIHLFKHHIWPCRNNAAASAVTTQQDIISFLCRMEINGIPQDAYWPTLLQDISSVCLTPYMPFNSGHYLYACGRSNAHSLAQTLLQYAEEHTKQQLGDEKKTWEDIGMPLLKGMYAFACEHYLETIAWFTPILPHINRVGGSDAENEIFYMIFCFSLLKSNQPDQAKTYFNRYLSHHQHTRLQAAWFSNVLL